MLAHHCWKFITSTDHPMRTEWTESIQVLIYGEMMVHFVFEKAFDLYSAVSMRERKERTQ